MRPLALAAIGLLTLPALAQRDRGSVAPPPAAIEPEVQSLAGCWRPYDVAQAGRQLTFTSATWTGYGYWDASGLIVVWWQSAGATAIGVYRYDGAELHGEWDYLPAASVEAGILRCDCPKPERLTRRPLDPPEP